MADWIVEKNCAYCWVELVSPGKEGEYCVSIYTAKLPDKAVYIRLKRANFTCSQFTLETWYKGSCGYIWHDGYGKISFPSCSDWKKVRIVCYYDADLNFRIVEKYVYNETEEKWEQVSKGSVGTGEPVESELSIGVWLPKGTGDGRIYLDSTKCYVA